MTAATIIGFASHALSAVENHLWQSTLYLLSASLLAVLLRKQWARIRYALWLSAAAKFLVPFSAFSAAGTWLAHFHQATSKSSGIVTVVAYVERPFALPSADAVNHSAGLLTWLPVLLCALWLAGSFIVLAHYCLRWRAVRAVRMAASARHEGREVDALCRAVRTAVIGREIPLLLSAGMFEPGIIGIRRPCLLWPVGISEHLNDAQLDAIMLHEAWHVRRRDNLTALLQMLVEIVFWFHPLVWWLGSQLLAERERACDEAVLQCGSDPRVYAESILTASKFCVETPLACVSGVTGSDLKQRMVRIMAQNGKIHLGVAGKLMLSALGLAVITAPVLTGMFAHRTVLAAVDAPAPGHAAPLETATIKASHATEQNGSWLQSHDGDLTFPNVTVRKLIEYAYDIKDYQLANAPAWIDSERYDVHATWQPSPRAETREVAPPPPPPQGGLVRQQLPPLGPVVSAAPGQLQAILKSVLATRFGLRINQEPENLRGYALEIASSGSKLPKPVAPTTTGDGEQIMTVREMAKDGNVELGTIGPLSNFANLLAEKAGGPVTDKTAQAGTYDVTLKWTGSEHDVEAIRSALDQQLGLSLVPLSTSVQMTHIEEIRPPALD